MTLGPLSQMWAELTGRSKKYVEHKSKALEIDNFLVRCACVVAGEVWLLRTDASGSLVPVLA